MKYGTLDRTGIEVSPYRLCAVMFGAVANRDHDDSVRIIHKAPDAGTNFVDTADAYSHGESEEDVGKALKDRRDRVVSAPKARLPMENDPNPQGNSRRRLVRAPETPRATWGPTTSILFQIHRPAPDTDVRFKGAETVLNDAVLDRIDATAPPGTDVGTPDMAHNPPTCRRTSSPSRPEQVEAVRPAADPPWGCTSTRSQGWTLAEEAGRAGPDRFHPLGTGSSGR